MTEAAIPVDLFNPGQVFACLGFLEAADVLLGDAEGGFDWDDQSRVRFTLRARGDENPFAAVLRFLAEAEVGRCAPIGYADSAINKKTGAAQEDEDEDEDHDLQLFESFPGPKGDRMALPVRLEATGRPPLVLEHWADGSQRNEFKLYAGNRSAYGIARAMLRGTHKKPTQKQTVGNVKTLGVAALWNLQHAELIAQPFDVLTLMGGSFNFDPRGAWTAIDAGYSPNAQKHGIAASPVVELLAAFGLQHARPDEYETRQVRYGAWHGRIPPMLARPALAGARVAVPVRRFRFALALSGKNKVVSFAQEDKYA